VSGTKFRHWFLTPFPPPDTFSSADTFSSVRDLLLRPGSPCGIKGGISIGKTDELGAAAIEDRFHVRRIHATILHQLGVDCNRLSYFFGGLDRRLVGVEGSEPIPQLFG